MASVSLTNIDKHYGSTQVLFDISLNIEDGEFAVFVGPSGCGKSTLLRCIAGLEAVSAGDIGIGDTNVTTAAPSDRDVAMVFQSYALYPHMTVQQNMEFGMKVNGVAPRERLERVNEAAQILQLESYLKRKPAALSGGQRQRVAIGRAIVKNPKVFLFDEPLSNLDAKLRVQMRIELEALHKRLTSTMIYVTHDQVEAMTMADKIVVLNEGVVEQIGQPMELYHHPRSEFVADFIGSPSMNFLDVGLQDSAVTVGQSTILYDYSGNDIKRCGIRPEHISLHGGDTKGLRANVKIKEALGGEALLYCTLADSDDNIIVKTNGDTQFDVGDNVSLEFPPNAIHLFNESGLAETNPLRS